MLEKNYVSRMTAVKFVAFLLSATTAFVSGPSLLAQDHAGVDEKGRFSILAGNHHAQMPLPSALSTMAVDSIPPFAAHPELESMRAPATPAEPVSNASADNLSFEENIPVSTSALTSKAIDASCLELTEMVAGNLTDEVSLETKKKMIEMALKMLARDITAQAESKIKAIEAEHQLDKARYQAQLMAMRSADSAAAQINRVVMPLYQSLEQNRVQAIAAENNNQWIAQTLLQMEQRFARQRQVATAANAMADQTRRKTIRLTSPEPTDSSRQQIEDLRAQLGYLQYQLQAEQDSRSGNRDSSVRAASFNEPLQPRQQRLEPMQKTRQRRIESFDRNDAHASDLNR